MVSKLESDYQQVKENLSVMQFYEKIVAKSVNNWV